MMPARHMRDADRALRLVDVLPAGARCAIGVDLQVALVDLDLDVVIDHRIHPDAGETGVPPRRGIERADAHQPVHAGLGLQPAIGVRPAHLQRRRLDAGLLALALLQQLHLVAVLLGPAHIHAHQHLGPVLRLGAAGAGVDLDVGVVGVGLAGQQALDLAPLRLLGQRAQRRHALGRHRRIAIGLGQSRSVPACRRPRVSSLRTPSICAGELIALAHHLLRGGGVVPERRDLRRARSVRRGGLRRHPSQRCLLSSATDCLICSFRASDSADMR